MTSHIDDNKTRELTEEGKKNWDKIFPPKPKKPSQWTLGSEEYFKEEEKLNDPIS